MNTKVYPFISAMIVVRNEESMIGQCLDSFINQKYPKDSYEIIVIDGMSTDKTLEEVEKRKGNFKNLKIIENPKKNLAAGWNLALQNASGNYVVRIDAHAYAYPDFFEKNLIALNEHEDVICVGGYIENLNVSRTGKIISAVLSSTFGVGNSKFRTSNKPQYADTAAYGMYKKEVLLELNGFNEEMERCQDIEMHARIRNRGGKFFLDPSIKTKYFARTTVKGFLKQAWKSGKWTVIARNKTNNATSIRHIVPLSFVIFNLASVLLLLFVPYYIIPYSLMMVVYLFLAIFYSIKSVNKLDNKFDVIIMPILFLLLHLSYGFGSLISYNKILLKGKKI